MIDGKKRKDMGIGGCQKRCSRVLRICCEAFLVKLFLEGYDYDDERLRKV